MAAGVNVGSWVHPQVQYWEAAGNEPPSWPPAGCQLHAGGSAHGQGWLTWKVPTAESFRESLILHRDRSGAVEAVPMEGAIPPSNGHADPTPSSPTSFPPHQGHIPGTFPPPLCPGHPNQKQPLPPLSQGSGCSPLYLPTSRLPTMRPDLTLMTADTFPVWGESAELWHCSPSLTPKQTPGTVALTS